MATLELRLEGDPALRRHCREVARVDERIRRQLDDMLDTLHATPGRRGAGRHRRWVSCGAWW